MKITKDMKLAMARYYLNCITSHYEIAVGTENVPWDKKADLDNIAAVAFEYGWSCRAAAGTFWFTKSVKGSILSFECHQQNFLEGGHRSVIHGDGRKS